MVPVPFHIRSSGYTGTVVQLCTGTVPLCCAGTGIGTITFTVFQDKSIMDISDLSAINNNFVSSSFFKDVSQIDLR